MSTGIGDTGGIRVKYGAAINAEIPRNYVGKTVRHRPTDTNVTNVTFIPYLACDMITLSFSGIFRYFRTLKTTVSRHVL